MIMINYFELERRSAAAKAAGEPVHITAAEFAALKERWSDPNSDPPANVPLVLFDVPCVIDE